MKIKYYNGESKNPYEGKDNNKAMFWWLEKDYLDIFTSDMLLDYLHIGLGDFEKYDDTPVAYKAVLFNSFAKTEQSMLDAKDHFKEFYRQYYG